MCFSHLRWDFVFQRPQHLLTRCAEKRRVFFVEEPTFSEDPPRMEIESRSPGVHRVVPCLPAGLDDAQQHSVLSRLVGEMFRRCAVDDYVLWYYTPMAIPFTRHLMPRAIVYDCMDELSAFAGAPPALCGYEAELFRRAHLVLTGGHSLFEAKQHKHPNIHPVPSSVDVAHFEKARSRVSDPVDQEGIPHPRLGFFGVLDERFDAALIDQIAAARPDLHIVLIGPVVKIDPNSLPRRPNIHYLGKKAYTDLPAYVGGWDVALLPFARNDATRFISPTKTPEYLAAGRPVVSTSIRDVVRPYGELGLVRIADTAEETIAAVDTCLADERGPLGDSRRKARLARVDTFLSEMSWDGTWAKVDALLTAATRPPLARRAH
ncbi:MAG: glycosyltransferase family 1 protein [Polyangiaceae bacterium]